MGTPEKKKRKHKKNKHSSSSPSKSNSSPDSYEHHYSHRKHKKSKSKKYSASRDRSRSGKKYRKSHNRDDDQSQKNTKPSPSHFNPNVWPPGNMEQSQGMFNSMAAMQGMPNMSGVGMGGMGGMAGMAGMGGMAGMAGMGGIGFPPFFQQRIPLQLPVPSNYKPNKTVRTIKNPKTQFKGRVYIPYTFDIAMVTLQDPYIQKEVPRQILNQLSAGVISQMEKRAKEQKQDDIIIKKIQSLQEEMTQYIKLLPIKRKKGENVENKSKLSQTASLVQIAQSKSLEQLLLTSEDQIDQELMELITKLGLKAVKESEVERELEPNPLIKEAKELYRTIKI